MTEHGWNDPPVFSFSSLQSGANRKTQMNKRVNHLTSQPLNHSTSSAGTPQKRDTSATPPTETFGPSSGGPPPVGPPLISSLVKEEGRHANGQEVNEAQSDCRRGNGDDSVNRTFDQVLTSLMELTERLCETMQKRTVDEIKRRLANLSKQWQEERLSTPVQNEMKKLTIALERGDSQTADSIHVALMVDHTSEVNQWMVGVKRLIAATKSTTTTDQTL